MDQMDPKYSCNICGKMFRLDTMYACYHGHYLCNKCYKQMYYKGKEQKCPHATCNAFIARNSEINKGEPMERSSLMFPHPYICSQSRQMDRNSSLNSLATVANPTSKKPVRCPHHGCNKTIAVSSLDSHFQHDHEHVALIVSSLETRNGLDFHFRDLYGDVRTLCLVLINFDGTQEEIGINKSANEDVPVCGIPEAIASQRSIFSRTSSTMAMPKPTFIVMAAKLTAKDFDMCDDDEEEVIPDVGFSPIDKIIFYVTSNIITNYSYTIAISTADQQTRLKYYGPLLSMNEDYRKLCNQGRGLIVNHFNVDAMSDRGAKNVCLDVIIHDKREINYDSD